MLSKMIGNILMGCLTIYLVVTCSGIMNIKSVTKILIKWFHHPGIFWEYSDGRCIWWRSPILATASDIWSPKKSPLLQIGIQAMAARKKWSLAASISQVSSESRQTNDLLWHPFGTTCHRQLVMMINMVRLAMRMVRMIIILHDDPTDGDRERR